jgi:hemerythrin
MALIDWNDSLSVNVAEIDLQHKKLIDQINELHEAMKTGKGKDILGKIVAALISYTATHFKTGEKYFARFAYPDTISHKKEHAAFVSNVVDFKDGFSYN